MKKRIQVLMVVLLIFSAVGCGKKQEEVDEEAIIRAKIMDTELDRLVELERKEAELETEIGMESEVESEENLEKETEIESEIEKETEELKETESVELVDVEQTKEVIQWSDTWKYAGNSKIHSDSVTLYKAVGNQKNIVIAVNAGHGTIGGSSVRTLCHPDGSPKTTGGSTGKGEIEASAVSGGTTMMDGTPESLVTLMLAVVVKDTLLENGYDVLMIRESEDVQIDNVARTIYANNNADCHISLHYDSSDMDKGLFCIGVPDIASLKSMEPVASHWREHNSLGDSVVKGAKSQGIKIYGDGFMGIDLTQNSYSTIPSIDIEVGDRKSDYSDRMLTNLAKGIVAGIDNYFGY